jgi:hypothetical protein
MDTTASFSSRSNAKRAAEKMLAAGTAPSVDYGFKPREDGRFEIVWQTAPEDQAPPPADPATAATEPQPDTAAKGAESSDPANGAAESEEAATAPPPGPGAAGSPAPEAELDPALFGAEDERLIAELTRRGYRVTQARQSRTQRPAQGQRRSKAVELDEAAARGVVPAKPDIRSHINNHYQKRFDRLAELAAAGDWDAVAGYTCNGVNSYAKMVRQYRDRLVAAHKAQETA